MHPLVRSNQALSRAIKTLILCLIILFVGSRVARGAPDSLVVAQSLKGTFRFTPDGTEYPPPHELIEVGGRLTIHGAVLDDSTITRLTGMEPAEADDQPEGGRPNVPFIRRLIRWQAVAARMCPLLDREQRVCLDALAGGNKRQLTYRP